MCRLGEWTTEALTCVSQCPAQPAPSGAESCQQSVAAENFDDVASATKRFASAEPVLHPFTEYWQVVDGRLVAMPPPPVGECVEYGEGVVAMMRDPDPRALDADY